MVTKEKLREVAKQIRESLDVDSISEKIVEALRYTEIYQTAENIMLFYPLPKEINLLPLLKDNKNFFLPKIKGDKLVACPYKIGDELTVSKFKTKEPVTKPINPEILDIVLVPALMVDSSFHRLGYGRGFYDKFLSKSVPNAIKIVPIPSALTIDEMPVESFDVQVDVVLDEA
jgi:5-formyltetrahydrofolate cyclo-ligase